MNTSFRNGLLIGIGLILIMGVKNAAVSPVGEVVKYEYATVEITGVPLNNCKIYLPGGQKEEKSVKGLGSLRETENILMNEMGASGWELVTFELDNLTFTFKRPLTQ